MFPRLCLQTRRYLPPLRRWNKSLGVAALVGIPIRGVVASPMVPAGARITTAAGIVPGDGGGIVLGDGIGGDGIAGKISAN